MSRKLVLVVLSLFALLALAACNAEPPSVTVKRGSFGRNADGFYEAKAGSVVCFNEDYSQDWLSVESGQGIFVEKDVVFRDNDLDGQVSVYESCDAALSAAGGDTGPVASDGAEPTAVPQVGASETVSRTTTDGLVWNNEMRAPEGNFLKFMACEDIAALLDIPAEQLPLIDGQCHLRSEEPILIMRMFEGVRALGGKGVYHPCDPTGWQSGLSFRVDDPSVNMVEKSADANVKPEKCPLPDPELGLDQPSEWPVQ